MAFRIDELSSNLSRYGYQKSSSFSAIITPPPSLTTSGIIGELDVRINSINLPGFNFGTDEIRQKGFGLGEKRPLSVSYDDIAITIILDGRGEIPKIMREWSEMIHPTSLEDFGMNDVEYFEYPNNYYGGLEIQIYSIDGTPHSRYNFIQPFPTQVGAIQMSWENANSIALLPVMFSYRSYNLNSTHSGY